MLYFGIELVIVIFFEMEGIVIVIVMDRVNQPDVRCDMHRTCDVSLDELIWQLMENILC
jgi:hypothetical protein